MKNHLLLAMISLHIFTIPLFSTNLLAGEGALGTAVNIPVNVDMDKVYKAITMFTGDGEYGRYPYRAYVYQRPSQDSTPQNEIIKLIKEKFKLREQSSFDEAAADPNRKASTIDPVTGYYVYDPEIAAFNRYQAEVKDQTFGECLSVGKDSRRYMTNLISVNQLENIEELKSKIDLEETSKILNLTEDEFFQDEDYVNKYEQLRNFYKIGIADLIKFLTPFEKADGKSIDFAYPLPMDFEAEYWTPEEVATQNIYADPRFGYFPAKVFINKDYIIVLIMRYADA